MSRESLLALAFSASLSAVALADEKRVVPVRTSVSVDVVEDAVRVVDIIARVQRERAERPPLDKPLPPKAEHPPRPPLPGRPAVESVEAPRVERPQLRREVREREHERAPNRRRSGHP